MKTARLTPNERANRIEFNVGQRLADAFNTKSYRGRNPAELAWLESRMQHWPERYSIFCWVAWEEFTFASAQSTLVRRLNEIDRGLLAALRRLVEAAKGLRQRQEVIAGVVERSFVHARLGVDLPPTQFERSLFDFVRDLELKCRSRAALSS